ncbi:MAG: preprotein translocase subunit SecE [Polyangiales bacterium]
METTQQERPAASLLLGPMKYLYTGYFVAGCLVAFLVSKFGELAWEGHDQITSGVGLAAGVAAVVWGWQNLRLRHLAIETIDELVAVTWPSKQETYTATSVVIATAVIAAVIVFLLDRFWSWFTDLIYVAS